MQRVESVTQLLRAAAAGDIQAGDRAYEVLYDSLRAMARRHLRRQAGHSLDTTELVHEAYLKLASHQAREVSDRGHFLCLAARVMRQILVDHARRRLSLKRGAGARPLELDEGDAVSLRQVETVLAVDQALATLGRDDPRLVAVVECKYFTGLTETETAIALSLSERTVRRLWQQARERLRGELSR